MQGTLQGSISSSHCSRFPGMPLSQLKQSSRGRVLPCRSLFAEWHRSHTGRHTLVGALDRPWGIMENKKNTNMVTSGMLKRFLAHLGVNYVSSLRSAAEEEQLFRDVIIKGNLGCNNHETVEWQRQETEVSSTINSWRTCSRKGYWGTWASSDWRGIYEQPSQYLHRGNQDDRARLLQWHTTREQEIGINQNKKLVLGIKNINYYEDDFAVEQVNQRGCEIFVLRGFQDVAGTAPHQTRQNS